MRRQYHIHDKITGISLCGLSRYTFYMSEHPKLANCSICWKVMGTLKVPE